MRRFSLLRFQSCRLQSAVMCGIILCHLVRQVQVRALTDVIAECPVYNVQKTRSPVHPLKEYNISSRCGERFTSPDHVVVVSRYNEDVSYLKDLGEGNYIVYDVDANNYNASERSDPYHGIPNRGKEAMAYLTYLAQYYDCLPKVVLFAHAHRKSLWHSIYDLDYNFKRARWNAVPGFALLHRFGLWYKFYAKNTTLNLLGGEVADDAAAGTNDPCFRVIGGKPYRFQAFAHFVRGEWVKRAWLMLLGQKYGDVPEAVHTSVAAEFFVTKERMQRHSQAFYRRAIQWIMEETTLFEATLGQRGMSSYETAVALELMWHVIFGESERFTELNVAECTLYDCGRSPPPQAAAKAAS